MKFTSDYITLFSLLIAAGWSPAQSPPPVVEQARMKAGPQADGRVLVPTNQMLHAAGKQVTFPARPVDLALSEDGRKLIVKNTGDLVFIDVARARVAYTLPLGKEMVGESIEMGKVYTGMSVTGLITTPKKIFVTRSGTLFSQAVPAIYIFQGNETNWLRRAFRLLLDNASLRNAEGLGLHSAAFQGHWQRRRH